MKTTCTVFCGLSLDGFIARPDGGLDWLEGDGTADLSDHGYDAFIASIDAIVIRPPQGRSLRSWYPVPNAMPISPWIGCE